MLLGGQVKLAVRLETNGSLSLSILFKQIEEPCLAEKFFISSSISWAWTKFSRPGSEKSMASQEILDRASGTTLSSPLTYRMSDVNCDIKSRCLSCLGDRCPPFLRAKVSGL